MYFPRIFPQNLETVPGKIETYGSLYTSLCLLYLRDLTSFAHVCDSVKQNASLLIISRCAGCYKSYTFQRPQLRSSRLSVSRLPGSREQVGQQPWKLHANFTHAQSGQTPGVLTRTWRIGLARLDGWLTQPGNTSPRLQRLPVTTNGAQCYFSLEDSSLSVLVPLLGNSAWSASFNFLQFPRNSSDLFPHISWLPDVVA